MGLLRELILTESNYQNTLDERYFVFKDKDYEFIVNHVIFPPLSTDAYFTKRGNADIYDFEIDFNVDVRVIDKWKAHVVSILAELQVAVSVEGDSGRLGITKYPTVEKIEKYRRLTDTAPTQDDFDENVGVEFYIQKAMDANPVYLKTLLSKVVTNGSSNLREFIRTHIDQLKQEAEDDERTGY
jgi:hypothetical protein